VPAAAVIPARQVLIRIAAVKALVVGVLPVGLFFGPGFWPAASESDPWHLGVAGAGWVGLAACYSFSAAAPNCTLVLTGRC
jgi:hypothetical protein